MSTFIVEQIQRRWPSEKYSVEKVSDGVRVAFALSAKSDYSFEVWASDDCEDAGIAACLSKTWQQKFPGHNHFWYMSFELPDFKSKDEMAIALLDTLNTLMTSDTRIEQAKGWFNWSFSCESLKAGCWTLIGGHVAFRWSNFKVPSITEKTQCFHAKALLPPEPH